MGLNQQLYDLGLGVGELYKRDAIEVKKTFARKCFKVWSLYLQKKIKELDKDFDLVLLAENFQESMVLLAHELCWPLDYVKSFKLNARKADYKVELSPQERQTLIAWQEGDMRLYQHFKSKFDKKVNPISNLYCKLLFRGKYFACLFLDLFPLSNMKSRS